MHYANVVPTSEDRQIAMHYASVVPTSEVRRTTMHCASVVPTSEVFQPCTTLVLFPLQKFVR